MGVTKILTSYEWLVVMQQEKELCSNPSDGELGGGLQLSGLSKTSPGKWWIHPNHE
jgi:hypothetical protein